MSKSKIASEFLEEKLTFENPEILEIKKKVQREIIPNRKKMLEEAEKEGDIAVKYEPRINMSDVIEVKYSIGTHGELRNFDYVENIIEIYSSKDLSDSKLIIRHHDNESELNSFPFTFTRMLERLPKKNTREYKTLILNDKLAIVPEINELDKIVTAFYKITQEEPMIDENGVELDDKGNPKKYKIK